MNQASLEEHGMAAPVDAQTIERRTAGSELPDIPVVELGGRSPSELFCDHREAAEALLRSGRRLYTSNGVMVADVLSRRWARRAGLPYLDEIAAVAAAAEAWGHRGGWLMNLSYEWGCTASVAADPAGPGMRMRRTLDWPLRGLGRHALVVRHGSTAGPWLNVTWPGFVGALTALAPGRFAVAINQAPMIQHGLTGVGDWLANRWRLYRSCALPPGFLLRHALEECRGYDDARRLLAETPVCLPVFYTLAGARPGEGCIIERLEDRAFIHEAPAAVGNCWLSPHLEGRPRGQFSGDRRAHLLARVAASGGTFEWLTPPVLNDDTRLAVVANAATGRLAVQGWEPEGPATRVLELAA